MTWSPTDDLVNPGTGRPGEPIDEAGTDDRPGGPRSGAAVVTVLLPVVLMLLRAIGELTLDEAPAAARRSTSSAPRSSRCWSA